tara:strand:+ start:654 stop:899 length:246 start_codon:yes stop_codon:yes gene_type:complete
MPDPQWYRDLTPRKQEAVDQIAHLVCGLGFSAIGGAYFSMVALYVREFWIQWPIDRALDTRVDMAFWIAGSGAWELLRLAV